MRTLLPVLLGLLGTLPGAVAGTLGVYAVLCLVMPENQGRRGLLAGVLGIVPGAIAGFIAAHSAASWLQAGSADAAWRAILAGSIAAALAGFAAAVAGLIVGARLAEARGVTNYAGERAAWALFYVALPATLVCAVAAFLLTRWVMRQAGLPATSV